MVRKKQRITCNFYLPLYEILHSFQKKFKVYDSKSYVLRVYSEDKDYVKQIYDKLYENKIVVKLVDDLNLVFAVSLNKEIENIIFRYLCI